MAVPIEAETPGSATLTEQDFYDSFAEWLEANDETTVAAALGGATSGQLTRILKCPQFWWKHRIPAHQRSAAPIHLKCLVMLQPIVTSLTQSARSPSIPS